MTVTNPHSQAGTVLQTGRVEFMQNRRVYFDDGKGVGQPLNEMN
jgi:hypothetical protein